MFVEEDFFEILQARLVLWAGLDFLAGEVTKSHNTSPLLELHDRGQIVITPHIAGATIESQRKAALSALTLLRRHLEDKR